MNTKENREIWLNAARKNKDQVKERIENGIEKNRKGWCKVRLTDENGNPIRNRKIKVTQKNHAFNFGANIFMLDEFESEEHNKAYREMFKKYFNLATVPFYWDTLEPEKGKPRYDKNSSKVYRRPAPELCVEYCEENGITPKLHCLIYDKFIPQWLPLNDMAGMEQAYDERFRQISERFSGRMLEFEVMNEILCTHDYKSVLPKRRDIVNWGFSLARKYFKNETLVINEAVIDLTKAGYRDPYFMMVENGLKDGAEIDKVGIQHHIFTGVGALDEKAYENEVKRGTDMVDPMAIFSSLDKLSELGLPLEITEVTVPTFGTTDEDEELQADLLELLYSVWFSHPAVDTVVYWNLPDGYAFVDKNNPHWNENNVKGGLFHHDLTPKKSAERLYKLINEVWHTDEELITDENGYAEFRGFYGEYTAECDGMISDFALHKNDCNAVDIVF